MPKVEDDSGREEMPDRTAFLNQIERLGLDRQKNWADAPAPNTALSFLRA